MGNSLESVIANIVMVELENTEAPNMSDLLKYFYRYVEHMIAFVKDSCTVTIMSVLNNHHNDRNKNDIKTHT